MTHRNVEILDDICEEARELANVEVNLRNALIEQLKFIELPKPAWPDYVYRAFIEADINNQDSLPLDDFVTWLRLLDLHFTRKTCTRIFSAIDRNQSGDVSWKEIASVLFGLETINLTRESRNFSKNEIIGTRRRASNNSKKPQMASPEMLYRGKSMVNDASKYKNINIFNSQSSNSILDSNSIDVDNAINNLKNLLDEDESSSSSSTSTSLPVPSSPKFSKPDAIMHVVVPSEGDEGSITPERRISIGGIVHHGFDDDQDLPHLDAEEDDDTAIA